MNEIEKNDIQMKAEVEGSKLLGQGREQSFENEKEMRPSSTHSLSSSHFHTPQHIL